MWFKLQEVKIAGKLAIKVNTLEVTWIKHTFLSDKSRVGQTHGTGRALCETDRSSEIDMFTKCETYAHFYSEQEVISASK